MNLRPLALGLLFGLVQLEAKAESQPFPDRVPSKLKLYIGGGLSTHINVDLDQGVVHVFRYRGNSLVKVTAVRPTLDEWTKFVEEINQAKLYAWASEYPSHGVNDGTHWSIDLEIGDRKLQSKGDNNYPTAGDEAKPTNKSFPQGKPFETYCAAVTHLIGGDFN